MNAFERIADTFKTQVQAGKPIALALAHAERQTKATSLSQAHVAEIEEILAAGKAVLPAGFPTTQTQRVAVLTIADIIRQIRP